MSASQRLPDEPGVYGAVINDFEEGRYRQRWMPGAFGEAKTLRGRNFSYKVIEDIWIEDADPPLRTIHKAEIVEEKL